MDGEGRFKPMKSSGIRDWLQEAHDVGMVSEYQLKELMAENERKQERLRAFGLPTFATYGPKDSFEETAELVPQEKKQSTSEHFLIRCAPKDLMSDLRIERTMDIAWPEVQEFVEKLPGGKDNYTVEIREFWNSDYGGAVISDGAGNIALEMVKGNLADIENKGLGDIKKGQLNSESGDIHFTYDGGPTDGEKQIMIGALKYFVPDLNREKLEQLKLYAEYAYSKDHGYRFFEATTEEGQKKFWTILDGRKPEQEERTGD